MLLSSTEAHLPDNSSEVKIDQFMVCGLGSLGQHCVAVLKEYGVRVSAIDEVPPRNWEVPDLSSLLEALITEDCRQPHILEQAKIHQCRAILLVTGNERVNIEAAFAARLLNPHIRLVVRSDQQNLNQLLSQDLGNFVAFEPTQLSASAFALAALDTDVLGYFNLEGRLLRITKHQMQLGDRWCDRWMIHGLNSRTRRVLSHTSDLSHWPKQFHQWEPEAIAQAGDTVIYVEVADPLPRYSQRPAKESQANLRHWWRQLGRRVTHQKPKQKWQQFWQWTSQYQTRLVAVICGITVLILLGGGTLLLRLEYPGIDLREAFSATAALLLGGYSDLFSTFKLTVPISGWLQLFSLGLTVAGTAFVAVLYALLTETLLSSRLHFTRRPPIPRSDHIVLIGLGRVGQQVAALLQELKQSLVGISATILDPGTLSQMPLVVGNITNALSKVNLSQAKSVVVLTEDDLMNLEVGLMAHTANASSRLVIRTYDQRFSDNVARLFPYAQVLCASALSAEVFAAAAFGENIISLFHFNNQTILATEYKVETGDTLNGLILAEVAYGYGVVPILYQQAEQEALLMPTDDLRLQIGDRLIVLATSSSLQRIERGEMAPRHWQLIIDTAPTRDAILEGANEIALIAGCSLHRARELMNHLPGILPRSLYKHQAQRLVRKLSNVQVSAHLVSTMGQADSDLSNTSTSGV